MSWTLAQLDSESTAAQWFSLVAWIMIIGAVAVLFIVMVGVGRRWKRRQLNAIDEQREARRASRAGHSGDRVDAWAASSERYVDHDKLSADDEDFDHTSDREPEDDDEQIPGSTAENEADPAQDPDQEERDPYGLFSDKPFQEADDEDEDDDDDEDWDENDEDEDEKR